MRCLSRPPLTCHPPLVPASVGAPVELAALVAAVDEVTDDVLAALTAAEALAADLTRLGDRLVGFYVERARAGGRSWADIGGHVGVTRQAAQQRFAGRWSSLTVDDLERAGAFERVTARTQDALRRADAEARRLGHGSIEIEHLLLALLDDPATIAARAVDALGVDRGTVLAAIRERIPAVDPPAAPTVTVGRAARRCLGRALDEALALGHNYVGTEHLLLAALDDSADLPTALADLGLRLDAARATVGRLLDEYLQARE